MCPFADRAESKCAAHWTLANVGQAFEHCADNYEHCPVYLNLIDERPGHERHEQQDVALRAAS